MAEDGGDWASNWRWAIRRVLHDWRVLRPKQLREALPGEFSCARLRVIRANACREMARETGVPIDCAKWVTRPPVHAGGSIQVVAREFPIRTEDYESPIPTDYVCKL